MGETATIVGEIKDPMHHDPMLTFKDADAPDGLRGPTDAENDTKAIQEALGDAVDGSAYESGDQVVTIQVPKTSDPTIEWLIDDPPEVDLDAV